MCPVRIVRPGIDHMIWVVQQKWELIGPVMILWSNFSLTVTSPSVPIVVLPSMVPHAVCCAGNTNPDYLLRSCTAVTEKPTRLGAQTLPLMKLSRSSVAPSALMHLRCCQPTMGLDDCSNWKSKQKNTPFQWWCDPHTVFRSEVGCICPVSCASLPEINSNLSINMIGGGRSTELKHIQRGWLYVNHVHRCHLQSKARIQDVTITNHWSQDTPPHPPLPLCPLQKRNWLQASKFMSTCCTIWTIFCSRAPDRLPWAAKRACFYEYGALRGSCVTLGWTPWRFSWVPNRYYGRLCGNTHV